MIQIINNTNDLNNNINNANDLNNNTNNNANDLNNNTNDNTNDMTSNMRNSVKESRLSLLFVPPAEGGGMETSYEKKFIFFN